MASPSLPWAGSRLVGTWKVWLSPPTAFPCHCTRPPRPVAVPTITIPESAARLLPPCLPAVAGCSLCRPESGISATSLVPECGSVHGVERGKSKAGGRSPRVATKPRHIHRNCMFHRAPSIPVTVDAFETQRPEMSPKVTTVRRFATTTPPIPVTLLRREDPG